MGGAHDRRTGACVEFTGPNKMNLIKKIGGWVKGIGEQVAEYAVNVAEKAMVALGILVGVGLTGLTSFGQTTPTDYGATLTTNLGTINTIWGTVATILIAVALVTVGVRFFRKVK